MMEHMADNNRIITFHNEREQSQSFDEALKLK